MTSEQGLILEFPCTTATQYEYWGSSAGSPKIQLTINDQDDPRFYVQKVSNVERVYIKTDRDNNFEPSYTISRSPAEKGGGTPATGVLSQDWNQEWTVIVCKLEIPDPLWKDESSRLVGLNEAKDRIARLNPWLYPENSALCLSALGYPTYELNLDAIGHNFPTGDGWSISIEVDFSNNHEPYVKFSYPTQQYPNQLDSNLAFPIKLGLTNGAPGQPWFPPQWYSLQYCLVDQQFTVSGGHEIFQSYLKYRQNGEGPENFPIPVIAEIDDFKFGLQSWTINVTPSSASTAVYTSTQTTPSFELDIEKVGIDLQNTNISVEIAYISKDNEDYQLTYYATGFVFLVESGNANAFTQCSNSNKLVKLAVLRQFDQTQAPYGLIKKGNEVENIVLYAYFGQQDNTAQDISIPTLSPGFPHPACVYQQYTDHTNNIRVLRIEELTQRDWVTFDRANSKMSFNMDKIQETVGRSDAASGAVIRQFTLTVQICETADETFCISAISGYQWNVISPISFTLHVYSCLIDSPSAPLTDVHYVRQLTQNDEGIAGGITYVLPYGSQFDFSCPKPKVRVKESDEGVWVWINDIVPGSAYSYISEEYQDDGQGKTKHKIVLDYKARPNAKAIDVEILQADQDQNNSVSFQIIAIEVEQFGQSTFFINWSRISDFQIATPGVQMMNPPTGLYTKSVEYIDFPPWLQVFSTNSGENTNVIVSDFPPQTTDYTKVFTLSTKTTFESVALAEDQTSPLQSLTIQVDKQINLYACGNWVLPPGLTPIKPITGGTQVKINDDWDDLSNPDFSISDQFNFEASFITRESISEIRYYIKTESEMANEITSPQPDNTCHGWQMKIIGLPGQTNPTFVTPFQSHITISFSDIINNGGLLELNFQLKNLNYKTDSTSMSVRISVYDCPNEIITPLLDQRIVLYGDTTTYTSQFTLDATMGLQVECLEYVKTTIKDQKSGAQCQLGSLTCNNVASYNVLTSAGDPFFKQEIQFNKSTPYSDNCGNFLVEIIYKNKEKDQDQIVSRIHLIIPYVIDENSSGDFWELPTVSSDLNYQVTFIKQQDLSERQVKYINSFNTCVNSDDFSIQYEPQLFPHQQARWSVTGGITGKVLSLSDTSFWSSSHENPDTFQESIDIIKVERFRTDIDNMTEYAIYHSTNTPEEPNNKYSINLTLVDCNADFSTPLPLGDILDLNNSNYDSARGEFVYEISTSSNGLDEYQIQFKQIPQNFPAYCGTQRNTVSFQQSDLNGVVATFDQGSTITVKRNMSGQTDVVELFNVSVKFTYKQFTILDVRIHFVDCLDAQYQTVPSGLQTAYQFQINQASIPEYTWAHNFALLPSICSLVSQVVCFGPHYAIRNQLYCKSSSGIGTSEVQMGSQAGTNCSTDPVCFTEFEYEVNENQANRYVKYKQTSNVSPDVEGDYIFNIFQWNPSISQTYTVQTFTVTLKVDCSDNAIVSAQPSTELIILDFNHEVGDQKQYPIFFPPFIVSHPVSCPDYTIQLREYSTDQPFAHGDYVLASETNYIEFEAMTNSDAQAFQPTSYVLELTLTGTSQKFQSAQFQINLLPNCKIEMLSFVPQNQFQLEATVNSHQIYTNDDNLMGIYSLPRVEFESAENRISCGDSNTEYSLLTSNGYPESEHNQQIMALTVHTDYSFWIRFIATQDSQVVNASQACDGLIDSNCIIPFKIQISMAGGPLLDWISGTVEYSSECTLFEEITKQEREQVWTWDIASANKISDGYMLRQPSVQISMPQLANFEMPSGGGVRETCGPIIYSVESAQVTSSWLSFPDAQQQPYIVVYATDQTLVSHKEEDAFSRVYSLNIHATLDWFQMTTKYWDPILNQDDRFNSLKMTLRDPCLAIKFEDTIEIGIRGVDETEFETQNYRFENLLVTSVLRSEQEVRISQIRYSVYQIEQAPINFCGQAQYEFEMGLKDGEENVSILKRKEPFIVFDQFYFSLYSSLASQEGIHYLTLRIKIPELGNFSQKISRITFQVKPCQVTSLNPSIQNELSGEFILEVGGNKLVKEMDLFYQEPKCDKTQSFDLVFIEVDIDQSIEEDMAAQIQQTKQSILESESPAEFQAMTAQDLRGIFQFSTKSNSVSFNILESDQHLSNRKFKVLLVGYFELDLASGQNYIVNVVSEPFTITTTKALKTENSAPYFVGALPSQIRLPIKTKEWSLGVGSVLDDENNEINLSLSAGFFSKSGNRLDWGQVLLQKTGGDSSGKVEVTLQMTVPVEAQAGFQGQFVLQFVDNGAVQRTSIPKRVELLIGVDQQVLQGEQSTSNDESDGADFDFEGVRIGSNQDQKDSNLPPPNFTIEAPDSLGFFNIQFDQPVILPDNLQEYLQNQNAIEIEYAQSESTSQHLLEEEIQQQFDWSVVKLGEDNIKIQLLFSHSRKVSISRFNLDQLNIKVHSLSAIKGRDSRKPVLASGEFQKKPIQQIFPSELEKQQIEIAEQTFQTSLSTFVSMNAITSIVFSTSFSFLWGLINSVQIVVMPVLYYLPDLPLNISSILVSLFRLSTFDLLDSVLEPIFNKEGDQSYSEIFEQAGMEGQNFISLVGLIIPLFTFYLLYIGFHKSLRYILQDQDWVGPRLANFLQPQMYSAVIIRFILESCVDLLISSIICLSLQHTEKIFSDEKQFISLTLAYLTLVGLICAPIYLIYAAKIHNRHVLEKREYLPYEELFENLNPKRLASLLFNIIFFLRRYLLVGFCMLTKDEFFDTSTTFYQVWSYQALSLTSLMFMLHVKPFDSVMTNQIEIFNESMVLVSGYHLLLFTPFVYYADQSKWGWSFFTLISLMAIYNIGVMGKAQIADVKLKVKRRVNVRKYRKRVEEKRQEQIAMMIRQGTYEEYKEQRKQIDKNQEKLSIQRKEEARKAKERAQKLQEIQEGDSDVSMSQESSILSVEPEKKPNKTRLIQKPSKEVSKEKVTDNLIVAEPSDPLTKIYAQNGAKFDQMELKKQRNQGKFHDIDLSQKTQPIGRYVKTVSMKDLQKVVEHTRQAEMRGAIKAQLEQQKRDRAKKYEQSRLEFANAFHQQQQYALSNNPRFGNLERRSNSTELLTSRHLQQRSSNNMMKTTSKRGSRNLQHPQQHHPLPEQNMMMSYRSSMIDYEEDKMTQSSQTLIKRNQNWQKFSLMESNDQTSPREHDQISRQKKEYKNLDDLVYQNDFIPQRYNTNQHKQQYYQQPNPTISSNQGQNVRGGSLSSQLREQKLHVASLEREVERQKQIAFNLMEQKRLDQVNQRKPQHMAQKIDPEDYFQQNSQSVSKFTQDGNMNPYGSIIGQSKNLKPASAIEYQPMRRRQEKKAPSESYWKEGKDVEIYEGAVASARIIRKNQAKLLGRRRE